jgi:hypothetical protein
LSKFSISQLFFFFFFFVEARTQIHENVQCMYHLILTTTFPFLLGFFFRWRLGLPRRLLALSNKWVVGYCHYSLWGKEKWKNEKCKFERMKFSGSFWHKLICKKSRVIRFRFMNTYLLIMHELCLNDWDIYDLTSS